MSKTDEGDRNMSNGDLVKIDLGYTTGATGPITAGGGVQEKP